MGENYADKPSNAPREPDRIKWERNDALAEMVAERTRNNPAFPALMAAAEQRRIVGRSCIGYHAELAPTVDFNKPIVAIAINHNTRVVTLGNEHAKAK